MKRILLGIVTIICTTAVYAVDYKGDFSYFHKKSDIDSKKGFVIVSASDVESFDDNGEKIIDRKKLSETLIQHPQYSAVYGFDRQSNFVKYRNQADYAEKNGIVIHLYNGGTVKIKEATITASSSYRKGVTLWDLLKQQSVL